MIAAETTTETVKFFVNGQWVESPGPRLYPITNPATGRQIARVPYATKDEVDRAVSRGA